MRGRLNWRWKDLCGFRGETSGRKSENSHNWRWSLCSVRTEEFVWREDESVSRIVGWRLQGALLLITVAVGIMRLLQVEHSYKNNPKLLAQLQHCEEYQIPLAVILGESELQRGVVKIREVVTRNETEVERGSLADELRKRLAAFCMNGTTWYNWTWN